MLGAMLLAGGALAEAPPPPIVGRFRLTRIAFPPSRFLAPAELAALAAPYVGREVTVAEIDALVAAIDALYARRGIVTARAVLPPQNVDGGVIRVDLIEGRLGTLRTTGNHYVDARYLAKQARIAPGETIDPRALASALSRFNRLSEVRLNASLTPGAEPGLTDVTLDAAEPRRDSLTLFVDNHAYAATGTYEGGALLRHRGLLGRDDRLSLLATGARGALTGTAAFDTPLGVDGTRGGISYGHGLTRVIAGAYAAFQGKGVSDEVAGHLDRPLWSDDRWLVLGSATGGYTRTRNSADGGFRYSTGTAKGGGALSISYRGSSRSLDAGIAASYAHGRVEAGADRRGYALFSGDATLDQRLVGALGLSVRGAWQLATAKGLPTDLLFLIGGATTVRGYTQGALAGDQGFHVGGQLDLALPGGGMAGGSLYVFADAGGVSGAIGRHGLASVGVGATMRIGTRLTAEANVGRPLERVTSGPRSVRASARLIWDVF